MAIINGVDSLAISEINGAQVTGFVTVAGVTVNFGGGIPVKLHGPWQTAGAACFNRQNGPSGHPGREFLYLTPDYTYAMIYADENLEVVWDELVKDQYYYIEAPGLAADEKTLLADTGGGIISVTNC